MTTIPEPYPTKTRLRLAHGVAAHEVRHYPWPEPLTVWRNNGLGEQTVTSRVAELVRAGLAAIPHSRIPTAFGWPVELTDAGWSWLDRHGGPKGHT